MENFSVLLSVYFKESPTHLDNCFQSIWDDQTLKPNQIVLVEDGMLNPLLDSVISKWQYKLGEIFTIVKLDSNVGLAIALNEGLKYCKFDLVARMDTDDISLPERFKHQISFMCLNTSVSASSGQIFEFDKLMEEQIDKRVLPTDYSILKKFVATRNPLSHPASIFRKSVIENVGGYPIFDNSQDWALWSLLVAKGYMIANLDCYILNMRTDSALFTRRGYKYFLNEFKIFRYQKKLGLYGWKTFTFNVLSKFILRTAPLKLKSFLYKTFR